jgi:hypothetical protein
MDLAGFFRALPHPVLAQYRELYLSDGAADAIDQTKRSSVVGMAAGEVDAISAGLAAHLGDRKTVRELLKSLPKSHHVALIALLQCQGVAGGTWLVQELTQTHGMSEDLWAEVLHGLGVRLLVFGNSRQSPPLFYVMPIPLQRELGKHFQKRLGVHSATEPDGIRLSTDTNYRHPVGYSLVSFLTYLRQNTIKVTRDEEVFKKAHEELLVFFGNLWGSGGEDKVLKWHLELVQELGLVRHRGGHLAVDDLVLGEYLGMTPRQRRDLLMGWFRGREGLLIWLLDELGRLDADEWTALKKLRTLYRRRYMGAVFHRRYVQKSYYLPPSGFYDPNPPLEVLQLAGLVESGLGQDGSYVRLSEEGRIFVEGEGLERIEANPSVRFLLQPNFDVLAPVGLPLDVLWKLGEVAELKAVDRANTYVLTRESVRSALDEGWRADDLIDFLKAGSQIGVPQNVESTIRDWVGSHGEVELHDALVVTAVPKRFKKVVSALKKKKIPFEILSTGALAVAREARDEVLEALRAAELGVAPMVRRHDLADDPATRQGPLHASIEGDEVEDEPEDAYFPTKSLVMLGAPTAEGGREVMKNRGSRSGKTGANAVGADLSVKPAAAGVGDLLKLSPSKTMSVIKAAIRLGLDVEVLYPSTGENDPGGLGRVTPASVAEVGGSSNFVGHHHRLDEEMKFHIKRIRGIRLAT